LGGQGKQLLEQGKSVEECSTEGGAREGESREDPLEKAQMNRGVES